MQARKALIGGEWVTSGETFTVTDPATLEPLAEVTDCGRDLVARALDAAAEALPRWRDTPAAERADLMRAAAGALRDRAEAIGAIMTAEQGKPLAEAVGEVRSGADHLLWAAEETRRLYGETVPGLTEGHRIWLLPEPVGVVAGITPWNFPVSMITRKLGPALAAGCTVVLKPAEPTPLSAVATAEAFTAAGLPPGVFNLVPTSRPAEFAAEVMADPRVGKISFTGSTAVGRNLIRQSADDVKRLSLELGGHAPVLVYPDADVPAAAAAVARGKFLNAGQACTSPNRIFVHRDVVDEFTAALAGHAEAITVGAGAEPGVTMGPLIGDAALAKVERHVEDALARGAKAVTGGRRLPGRGAFYPPTVLSGVTGDMLICREETFGPVAPVLTFGDGDDVVARANDTPYGLVAYLWTGGLNRALRVTEALRFGMVTVNGGPVAPPQGPFGGVKNSGYGREGGHHGVADYLEYKYVSVGLDQ
ncbi:NAD-dependent succinate-semialdehyde dehydrogenase [Spongiactinospora sp. TRM90649]|uniref:NAD-dependent succinate-semialdehyde dehydrogenase n=1 Tax=Spongiactinospora sp. TRM90649 TaxID=3031114 RepID=UPI0023F90F29|nr:NAD-dependent succinate-semialdehyde dehydrogenase [Spongiactinospora sp. TRM90649]MDF5755603.1 NAD-dependent succinate-semialdehyde dehydrogenase [Spongiactinospora sp. TRM90649]